jgi:hypothetical protein
MGAAAPRTQPAVLPIAVNRPAANPARVAVPQTARSASLTRTAVPTMLVAPQRRASKPVNSGAGRFAPRPAQSGRYSITQAASPEILSAFAQLPYRLWAGRHCQRAPGDLTYQDTVESLLPGRCIRSQAARAKRSLRRHVERSLHRLRGDERPRRFAKLSATPRGRIHRRLGLCERRAQSVSTDCVTWGGRPTGRAIRTVVSLFRFSEYLDDSATRRWW